MIPLFLFHSLNMFTVSQVTHWDCALYL